MSCQKESFYVNLAFFDVRFVLSTESLDDHITFREYVMSVMHVSRIGSTNVKITKLMSLN